MSENHTPTGFSHETIETNNFLMIVLILLVIAIGGLVEIVPLFFQHSTTEPVPGLKPYTALELTGRDIYLREGCYNCHSQMIRPFRAETLRYGHYSVAGEFVYDHPFQWGSKRTGPDLQRVGGKYSDDWHRIHLNNPRDVVPESIMPAYPWLAQNALNPDDVTAKMKVMRTLGVPYTDDDIAHGPEMLKGKTEVDALIAYLQVLGTAIKDTAPAASPVASAPVAAPVAAASEAAAPVAAAPADAASVVTAPGLVKFFFATGKSDLASGSDTALAEIVAATKAGKKAVVSGFHDASGDPVKNDLLAKDRAIAVKKQLLSLGVAEDAIVLQKPATAEAGGDPAQARRVDVTLQ